MLNGERKLKQMIGSSSNSSKLQLEISDNPKTKLIEDAKN
jgi:hypothetical protein